MKTNLGVILRVKTCEVFLCFLVIIFLGSIVLTSHWLLCINCFTSLVRFTGYYTEYKLQLGRGSNARGRHGCLPRARARSFLHSLIPSASYAG